MENRKKCNPLVLIIALIVLLVSILIISPLAKSPEMYRGYFGYIDEKRNTMLELTGAAAAISTAITLVPDDVASPIANKIADTSTYFMIILCVLTLEKYVLTLGGFAAFAFLFPAGIISFMVFYIFRAAIFRRLGIRAVILGIALVGIVPVSLETSRIIERTFDASIQETIEAAQNGSLEIEASVEEEEQGVIESIWKKISGGVTGFRKKAEHWLNNFLEAVAVLLVTNCIIPLIVAAIFIWIVKALFQVGRTETVRIEGKSVG